MTINPSLDLVPGNPDLWLNLGAFYGRHDLVQPAVEAFEIALQLRGLWKLFSSTNTNVCHINMLPHDVTEGRVGSL